MIRGVGLAPPWALGGVALTAFGLRLVAGMSRTAESSWWESGYSHYGTIAQNIILYHELRLDSALAPRPPLYPLLLASAYALGGQSDILPVFIQAVIGGGTVLVTFAIARELFGGSVAMLAALIVAAYPYYVVHDTAQQET